MKPILQLLALALFGLSLWAQNPNTPIYPGGIATDNNLLVSSDNAIGTLAAPMTATQTSVQLASAASFIAPTALSIQSELIFCPTVNYTTNTFSSCTRGWQGSTAAAYTSGTYVSQNRIAYYHNQSAAEIKAIETALGINFSGWSSETVAYSSSPTFSTATRASVISLAGNISSFTLASGRDGQQKVLTFCQGAGNNTVGAPSNVHGFFTIGAIASKCNTQTFVYSAIESAWLAESPGVINQ